MKTGKQVNDYFRFKQEMQGGQLRNLYIFTGSEEFLIEEAVEAIKQGKIRDFTQDAGFNRVDGQVLPLEQVLDMAQTVSLFEGQRLVVVNNAPYFAKGNKCDESLLGRLLEINRAKEGPCIVFTCTEFYKANAANKKLLAAGVVFQFENLKLYQLYQWLRERLDRAGKDASDEVLELLVHRVGKDTRRLASEIDKLVVFLGKQKELDEAAVMNATSRSLSGDIFALTEAVAEGKTARALYLLRDLLAAGEPPLRILTMMVRHFRLLGETLELLNRNCPREELAAELGVYPFVAEKLVSQAGRLDEAMLSRFVDLLLQTDLDIKRGRIEQTLALETLVVALGRKKTG